MYHVVPALADAAQVVFPVCGVLAHELGKRGEDDDALDRQLLALEGEVWADIDVVCGRLRWFWRGDVGKRPLWQWRVGSVEGEGIGCVDGHVDLGDAVEVWLEPVRRR